MSIGAQGAVNTKKKSGYRFHSLSEDKADLIIFSFDRPLQLYAFLESVNTYVTGLGSITIILRTSNSDFFRGYRKLMEDFSGIKWLRQGTGPANNFRKLLINALEESPHEYVIFGVDDLIVKDNVDLVYCISSIEKYKAYGFYLRLGKHLTHCYPKSSDQQVPPTKHLEENVFSWLFNEGEHDWHYPNMVDMALYRKKEVCDTFKEITFKCPNSLEGAWGSKADYRKSGLFFAESKVVNIPINKVQQFSNLLNMNLYTPKELLQMFLKGLKIDIRPLHLVVNIAGHMEWQPTFITREKAL